MVLDPVVISEENVFLRFKLKTLINILSNVHILAELHNTCNYTTTAILCITHLRIFI